MFPVVALYQCLQPWFLAVMSLEKTQGLKLSKSSNRWPLRLVSGFGPCDVTCFWGPASMERIMVWACWAKGAFYATNMGWGYHGL